jgi:hypothetical protein
MPISYVPAPGKRIPMPGNRADWPLTGRPINELSPFERRLVADGDLVPLDEKTTVQPKKPAGETGDEK